MQYFQFSSPFGEWVLFGDELGIQRLAFQLVPESMAFNALD